MILITMGKTNVFTKWFFYKSKNEFTIRIGWFLFSITKKEG
jgi:hypothetical protein